MRISFLLFTILFSTFLFGQEKASSKNVEKLLNDAAKFYHDQEYVKALNFSKEALSISLDTKDEYHLALSYNLIGTIYNEFSQTERALNFYTKGLAYANKLENDTVRLWINSNIGNVYYYNDINVEKGISYYKKSLKLAEKIKDSSQIIFIRLNIANAYFGIDQIDEGISFIKPLALDIEKKGNAESKITYYDLMGKFYSLKESKLEAEKYFFKSMQLAKEQNSVVGLQDIYRNISQHYTNFNNIEKAKKYLKLADALVVDVNSPEKLDTIEQITIQIELDEYKYQFERIELKNELQNQKIHTSQIIIISICVIIAILLILLYTFYRNNRIRKKNNIDLSAANEELIKAKNKAEENAILKTQFISTVSHELRTPLYGVIGLTNIIIDETKDFANQENMYSLRFSAQYLVALVNDLLEINKADENKIILKNVSFNIREQIEIISNLLISAADGNENKLLIEIDENIPQILYGDSVRLSQILINLITNALKFTEKGVVKIEIKLFSINDLNCEVEFKVSDNGIGIRKEDQERIFEKFVQIDRREKDYQGTGLGLSIVKKLVELFEGSITVVSEENKGTTFTFTTRFEYLNSIPVSNIPKFDDSSTNQKINFLVVEDNKINQIVTKKIIERKNYSCTIVESGYEAIDLLKKNVFDIILMDINMPLIDGYETSKMIRELGIKTPIIALTAFERIDVEAKAKKFGITDVIIKPFNAEILFEMVGKYMSE